MKYIERILGAAVIFVTANLPLLSKLTQAGTTCGNFTWIWCVN